MMFSARISPADILLQRESGKPWSILDMKPGQTVTAKVVDLPSPGRAQLLVAGQKVTAATDLPLKPGMDILLEVTRERDSILLKTSAPLPVLKASFSQSGLGRSPARFFSQIAQALPQLGSTQEPVLKNILMDLSLKSGQRDEGFLPRLMANLGMNLEKKIAGFLAGTNKADVKPVMDMMVKQNLKAAVLNILSTEGEGVKSQTMRGISNALESFQQLNTQTGDASRFLIPFPILTGDQFEFGQLLVDTGKKGGDNDEKKVLGVSFLLNMTALGSVRADFTIFEKSLAGRFLLEDRETCTYMEGLVPELKQRLAEIDYQARRIECRVGEPKALAPNALVQSLVDPGRNSGLEVIV